MRRGRARPIAGAHGAPRLTPSIASRIVSPIATLLVTLLATLLVASAVPWMRAAAQGGLPPIPPTPVRGAGGAGGGAGADSVRPLHRDRLLVDWVPPDSIMRELLERRGYRSVRYQGGRMTFDAATRALRLVGKPSAVERDGTLLVGDTIVYDDSTQFVVARGDTVVLRDPSREDSDDFVALGEIRYDLETQEGTTGAFSTSVVSGQRLYLTAEEGTLLGDTTSVGGRRIFFHRGDFTYCDLDEPHFHFAAGDIKFVSDNVVVARPGVLYIGEVPVFWLPFFFQDVRGGRRSGLLTPRFGLAELFRNSANYQRTVENVGWFFALSDYLDAQVSMDWRSGTRATDRDPGWLRGNTDLRYKWRSRFIDGSFSYSFLRQFSGQRNTSVSWRHAQQFSKATRLNANVNWTQNTSVQRQTAFNPVAATATIVSQVNYQTAYGPARVSVGGTRRQYPGRSQVDLDLPNLSVAVQTLSVGALEWTPSFRFNTSRNTDIDQGIQFGWVYRPGPGGALDSTRVRADRVRTVAGLESPIKLFDFELRNSFSFDERVDDYPEQRVIRDVNDTSQVVTRVFARRFTSNVDWTPSFNLPRFFQGTWNVSPQVQLANVDQGYGLFVRSELSGGQWVSQGKRLVYGVSTAPTFYAVVQRGIGPVEAFRHKIQPSLSYTLSPAAEVSDEFLRATGRTRAGYLGALPRNAVTLSFNTNLEAKLRDRPQPAPLLPGADEDSTAEGTGAARRRAAGGAAGGGEGRKINLLALNFSSLTWDFIRADTAGTGLAERTFSVSARSDLLPGFDFRMGYELFQGDPLSDTAVFKPFRTDLGVNFSLDGQSGLVALLGRLFGRGGDIERPEDQDSLTQAARDDFTQRGDARAAAGAGARGAAVRLPGVGAGWRASFTYNAARQRPPVGGTQITIDPTAQCANQFTVGSFAYITCVEQAQNAPPAGFLPGGGTTIGGPVFIAPPSENVSGNLSFGLTPKWAAQLSGQYDLVRGDFGSVQVALQRELHDWDAIFSFTRAPNGNFAFNFFISLKASPEVKFNYDRRTVR